MSEIINIFMCEELVKRREKISIPNWNEAIPTKVNRFTTETGTLNSAIVGGKAKKERILVI